MTYLSRPHQKSTATHIQCPNCKRWNSKYRNKCWNCGEELSG